MDSLDLQMAANTDELLVLTSEMFLKLVPLVLAILAIMVAFKFAHDLISLVRLSFSRIRQSLE